MTSTKLPLLVLLGPTAVGKTEIALQLARDLDAEIVSADSRLFYRGMDIGTAKPTREEQARVRHHLIDIADPDHVLSLAVFQQQALAAITDIQSRGKLPLLVGGTGQYLRAVTEGWTPPAVQADERLRKVLDRLQGERGKDWLHDKLRFVDPAAAAQIDARNARRTIRALEVILTTGRKFSDQRSHGQLSYDLTTIGLMRARPELYERIDERIESMFARGLLDEVRRLLAKGYSADLPTLSAIGYRQCVRVLAGEMTLEQAKTEMRRATRLLVRRQANWFKASDPDIQWFDAARSGVPEIELFIQEDRSRGAGG